MTALSKCCSKCGLSKPLSEFYSCKRRSHIDGKETLCKECHRNYDKEKEKENILKYRRDPVFRARVKARRNKSIKKWIKTDHGKLYKKQYLKRGYVRDRNKKITWRWRHTDRVMKHLRKYYRDRRKYDTGYRIRSRLTIYVHKAVKYLAKTWKTMDLIGCTIEKLKTHLQKTALSNGYLNFNINDYSSQEYHIDHVRPCASFDLTDMGQVRQCFHYTNLQILRADLNILKKAKVDWDNPEVAGNADQYLKDG